MLKKFLLKFKFVRAIINTIDHQKDKRKYRENKNKLPKFNYLPIKKNKVVFDNFGGKSFGGRPRIIAEKLLKTNKKLDLVWIANEKPKDLPEKIRWVKYGTEDAIREWATAKVWVDNIRNSIRPKKRKRQFYIQTWHGEVGIKAVEKDVEEFLSNYYVEMAKNDSIMTDLFLSSCEWCTDLIKKSFWYHGEIMPVKFIEDKSENEREFITNKVKEFFSVEKQKRIILYAPTFRDSGTLEVYDLDYTKLIDELNKIYNEDFCVLVRLHPNILQYAEKIQYSENIINASTYPDVMDIIFASTFVISDYSSVLFEAMKYGVYSLIFAKDYKEYFSKERKSYFDIKKLPAPFAQNNNELIKNIISFDKNKYKIAVDLFNSSVGYYDDNCSISKLRDRIYKICGINI